MSNSSAYSSLLPWVLREEDIASGAVEFFDSYTCYVGDNDAPQCIKNLHGIHVTLCKTNANGKCGLHAVLGIPTSGQLRVKDEREVLLTLFKGTYDNVKSRLLQQDVDSGTSALVVLNNVFSEIWPSFIQPCMDFEFKGNRTDSAQDQQERCLYEKEIRKDNNFMDSLRDAYLEQEHTKKMQEDRKVDELDGFYF